MSDRRMMAERVGRVRYRANLRRLVRDRSGTSLVKFAIASPLMLAMVAAPIDYIHYLHQRTMLRAGTDTASLAAAKEMSLTNTQRYDLSAAVDRTVKDYMAAHSGRRTQNAPVVSTSTSDDPLGVSVRATQRFESFFSGLLSISRNSVEAHSVAEVVGKPNISVLGLNGVEVGTISLEHQARVTGQNCAVYSNSTNAMGLKAKNSAFLKADIICSRGGKDGGPGNFSPAPITDCPGFDDPLGGRAEPAVGTCDPDQSVKITNDTVLAPGTYCGLDVGNGASVTLQSGIYVFKDGPLVVAEHGKLIGQDVALYFTGSNSTLRFEADSTISLEGPTSGALAGIVVFGSRSLDPATSFQILSNDARKLTGTIYIPRGELKVGANAPVADQSAYTAIIADTMRLYGGPHLVLNTNYSNTNVPVPDGIKGAGMPVRLAR